MKATIGDLELVYESFGDPAARPLLLIMGVGAPMTVWRDEFCQGLADRHFFVIRYDHRDVGRSTHLDHLPVPDLEAVASGGARADYTLDDMAADAAGLLDHLGIAKAHIVGVSMGGMIAQLVVLNHPERVLSLTSMMSSLGGEDAVQPAPEVRQAMGAMRPEGGAARHLAAILSAPSRRERLQKTGVPTLVVHGDADPFVPPENGHRTAAAIPGARLLVLGGIGHHLAEETWPEVTDAIAELALRAEAAQVPSGH